ncbi:uncharacterized protein [Ptychodera flava]|uniref:uncharacterized protein n=1 Tax=Ptychodera flava TaxID=63121 RepID=UPI003969DCCD
MKKDAEREERLKTAKLSPQRQLYDIIIAPIEKSLAGVEQVLIIPDKEISQVPVDLLENEKNVKLNATFKISCVPSIAVLDVLTKQTQHEEREQKAKKSYHEFFPVYLDDHLRVVVPPDQRPLSPIRKQLRAAPLMAREKNINPSMITFGTNHYDYEPTPRHRQDKAQVILARERAKVGTLITHSSTDTEVSKGEGAVAEFKQDSLQHKSLVIGNPILPKKLKLHGQIWQPAGELIVSQCEAFNVADYLDTKALIGSDATKGNVLSKFSETTLIHIATYGSWEDSVLVFRPSPTSQPNPDGSYNEGHYQIGIKDIMNVEMKADLVVLSCCYGEIHRDIDFTLPSALLAAGSLILCTGLPSC